MDINLSNAWTQFRLTNAFEDGIALAHLLLRTNTLEFYEENAAVTPELIPVLPFLRQVALPEASKVLDQLVWNHPFLGSGYDIKLWARHGFFRDLETSESLYKYTNVYCNNIPLASLRIQTYYELKTSLNWCKKFYTPFALLPPKQISLTRIGKKEYFFVADYHDELCNNFQIIVEDNPVFDFNQENAPPIYPFKHGQTHGRMKEITKDDYVESYRGTAAWELRQFTYESLPDFAKPSLPPAEAFDTPHFAIAGITTRQQIGGFSEYGDYGEWENFTYPIAKIYLGYFHNLLLIDPSSNFGWIWSEKIFKYQCPDCHYELETTEDRIIRRCRECHGFWDRIVLEPSQIIINPNFPLTPFPPKSTNEALAFLQHFYDDISEGDIYSVLGGQQLSVSLREESYGPVEN